MIYTVPSLTAKCIKVLFRQKSKRMFIFFSSFFVGSCLLLMFFGAHSKMYRYLTSDGYIETELNLNCSKYVNGYPFCSALSKVNRSEEKSLSDFLFGSSQHGKDSLYLSSGHKQINYQAVSYLLSSMLMNGAPVLGLADYLKLSDYSNMMLGNNSSSFFSTNSLLYERFRYLLDARDLEVRLSPNNCFTQSFREHLLAQDQKTNVIIVNSASEATRNKNKLWVWIEVVPGEFGGSDYRAFTRAARGCTGISTDQSCISFDSNPYECVNRKFLQCIDHCFDMNNSTKTNSELFGGSKSDRSVFRYLYRRIPSVSFSFSSVTIPDTRNFEWSLRRIALPRVQSGQVLYYTSGFLTFQLEIQNFFQSIGVFNAVYDPLEELLSGIERGSGYQTLANRSSKLVLKPVNSTSVSNLFHQQEVVDAISTYKIIGELINLFAMESNISNTEDKLVDILSKIPVKSSVIPVSVFQRAFPTHEYQQYAFWRAFGDMFAIALITLFSLIPALVAGEFRKEVNKGHLMVLSTLVGVRYYQSVLAWLICNAVCSLIMAAMCGLFLFPILSDSSVLFVLILNLVIFSAGQGPISIGLSCLVNKPDIAVVFVPIVTFIMMLPGLLYYNVAYDVQRNKVVELLLDFLPASGITLVVRQICSLQAVGISATFYSRADISNLPLVLHTIMLSIVALLYSLVCVVVIGVLNRRRQTLHHEGKLAHHSNSMHSDTSGGSAGSMYGLFIGFIVNPLSSFIRSAFFCFVGLLVVVFQSSYFRRDAAEFSDETSHRSSFSIANLRQVGSAFINDDDDVLYEEIEMNDCAVDAERTFVKQDSDESVSDVKVPALKLDNVCKQYKTGYNLVNILENVTCELRENTITCLLGSNGAGKSTLMRVIAGFDEDYDGRVTLKDYSPEVDGTVFNPLSKLWPFGTNNRMFRRRQIGWCAQDDILFENLTLMENLNVFYSVQGIKFDNLEVLGKVEQELKELQLFQHRDKRVKDLSGGMKRRLCLLLAFIGAPRCVLLDEPTSGCDGYTRELVRKLILKQKSQCTILLSTHHLDDVNILADNVWFLSEKRLMYDGSVNELLSSKYLKDKSIDGMSGANKYLEFSTTNESIGLSFIGYFENELFEKKIISRTNSSWYVGTKVTCSWILSDQYFAKLHDFITTINTAKDWSLHVPNVYDSLIDLFLNVSANVDDQEQISETTPLVQKKIMSQNVPSELKEDCVQGSLSSTKSNDSLVNLKKYCQQILILFYLRYTELRAHRYQFLFLQWVLPFVVIGVIALSTADVRFPKTLLSGEVQGGLGEIFMQNGVERPASIYSVHDFFDSYIERCDATGTQCSLVSNIVDPASSDVISSMDLFTSYSGKSSVNFENEMCRNSNHLFSDLYDSYYNHTELDRWGAFVQNDELDNFIGTNLLLPQSSLSLSASVIFNSIAQLHTKICNNSLVNESGVNDFVNIGTIREISFCDIEAPALTIKLVSNLNTSEPGLLLSSFQSIRADITVLTNVTSFHAAPIMLKEILPFVKSGASAMSESNYVDIFTGSESIIPGAKIANLYNLYSHPLPEEINSSPMQLESGQLCALMIAIYMFIVASSSVRIIASYRSNGFKVQLHLAGVTPKVYWIANFIWDSTCIFCSLCVVLAVIFLNGSPLSDYFFDMPLDIFNIFPVNLTIIAVCFLFSAASTAANYGSCVISKDMLSSQLYILVSSVIGGLFMRLYLERQHTGVIYEYLNGVLGLISPSYVFASIVCDTFNYHSRYLLAKNFIGLNTVRDDLKIQGILQQNLHVLLCQTMVYLLITVLFDMYYLRIVRFFWLAKHQFTRKYRISELEKLKPMNLSELLSIFSIKESKGAPCARSRTASISRSYSSRSSARVHFLFDSPDASVKQKIDNTLAISRYWLKYSEDCTWSLRDISLNLRTGDRLALMGGNGGGKSSLFRSIVLGYSVDTFKFQCADILSSETGINLFGLDVLREAWAIAGSGMMGYVSQESSLMEYLTVQELFFIFDGLKRISTGDFSWSRKQSSSGSPMAKIIGSKYENFPISSLSGGYKKKAAIAIANFHRPDLLLLDEVTSGIDPIAAEGIVNTLQSSLYASQSVIFTSHRIDECVQLCHKVVILEDGRVVLTGNISEFEQLCLLHYQVEVNISEMVPDLRALLTEKLTNLCGQGDTHSDKEEYSIDSLFMYSTVFGKIICNKISAPVAIMWTCLLQLQSAGFVKNFTFREISMDDLCSTLIAKGKVEHL